MAYTDVYKLQNLSDVEQSVVFDGRVESIRPFGSVDVPYKLALKFLQERSRWVREWQPVQVPPIGPTEDVMWVANMTGNPFAESEVTVPRIRKGEKEFIKVENPLSIPTILSYKMSIGQTQAPVRRDPSTTEILNHPKVNVQIPPYTRVRVGVNCGNWLLRRDAIQETHHIGKIIHAQEPSDHEPNQSWPLDDIRLYARLVDSKTFTDDFICGPEKSFGDDEVLLAQARLDLLHKLFFRLVDDRYPRISRSDFSDFKNAIGVQEPEPKKNRGRPSKDANEAIARMARG